MTAGWRSVVHEPAPLLPGSDDVTEGYYRLEASERDAARETLAVQQDAIDLWYRGLTLYFRGLSSSWLPPAQANDLVEARMYDLQTRLLGLGIRTAKAALDALLAGAYSAAYSCIRHMVETFIQCLYLVRKPSDYSLWLSPPEAAPRLSRSKTPSVGVMVRAIREGDDTIPQVLKDFAQKAYESWDSMCIGSHPTGEGLYQTSGLDRADDRPVGATYNRKMCLIGLDHGLSGLDQLLIAVEAIKVHDPTWKEAHGAWRRGVREWRTRRTPDLLAAYSPDDGGRATAGS